MTRYTSYYSDLNEINLQNYIIETINNEMYKIGQTLERDNELQLSIQEKLSNFLNNMEYLESKGYVVSSAQIRYSSESSCDEQDPINSILTTFQLTNGV